MIEILLGYVDGNKTVIVSNLSDLETTINQWKNNALTSLNQCSTAVCVTLKDDINSIGINVDYEQMVSTLNIFLNTWYVARNLEGANIDWHIACVCL